MTIEHRIVSGAAALAVAAGALVGVGGGADAETLKFRIEVPRHLSVSKGEYSNACAMDVWAWGTEGSAVAYSKVSVIAPNGHNPPPYNRVLPGYQVGYGVGCAGSVDHAGKYRIRVVAYDKSGKALGSREDYWYEKFDTVVQNFNAAPEPVRKGKTLYVSGRLRRVNNIGTAYTGYSGKSMRIYFRPTGGKTWTYMGSAKTNSSGDFRKGFKAKASGTWRAYFPGTSRFDKQASRDDYVQVR
ncbi:hypothetical protein [Actinomadura decatromicini]|uniref:Uncharacterized protein n=1 Tax=Actinomadura decatromicini TaxID=2604572 RepID=A0A5D3FLD4_9ACTN|nr:hypothetical protein [Actinomadura decatromicini]TYK49111.1 hypothetical protein FXF68_14940 [Actinomadura decatromicini]